MSLLSQFADFMTPLYLCYYFTIRKSASAFYNHSTVAECCRIKQSYNLSNECEDKKKTKNKSLHKKPKQHKMNSTDFGARASLNVEVTFCSVLK